MADSQRGRKLTKLRLRNTSRSIINQIAVTFADSTSPVLEEALASNTLAEDDACELEYFLYERRALVWKHESSSAVYIGANETQDLEIEIHGKRGFTRGSIFTQYSNSHEPTKSLGIRARRLEMTIAVTVNASLELVTCDFIPFISSFDRSAGRYPDQCKCDFFLVLEMRNSWIVSLDMQLVVEDPRQPSQLISQSLHSGQTRRIIIPLRRIKLSSSQVELPLPRKSKKRQFVVPTASSVSSVALARQAWWYRQNILDSLRGIWTEQTKGGRKGNIELRGIRLNERHLRVVRLEEMEAEIEVRSLDEMNICHQLRIKIRNNQGSLDLNFYCLPNLGVRCMCFAQLVLIPDERLSRTIFVDGILQSQTMSIASHEDSSWETKVTLLAQGKFEVGVVIQELLKGDKSYLGRRWSSDVRTELTR
jgi:hypothetical protein